MQEREQLGQLIIDICISSDDKTATKTLTIGFVSSACSCLQHQSESSTYLQYTSNLRKLYVADVSTTKQVNYPCTCVVSAHVHPLPITVGCVQSSGGEQLKVAAIEFSITAFELSLQIRSTNKLRPNSNTVNTCL